MAYNKIDDIIISDAHIMFRNFSGEEKKFNRAGNRNFCVIIDDEDMVRKLINDGWHLRTLPPREDEDEPPRYYLQVKVMFGQIPPKVYLITRNRKTRLDEESINSLDYAEIKNVDLTIRPYNWEMPSGATGISAYLKTMYVTLEEDAFAEKYADYEYPEEVPF